MKAQIFFICSWLQQQNWWAEESEEDDGEMAVSIK